MNPLSLYILLFAGLLISGASSSSTESEELIAASNESKSFALSPLPVSPGSPLDLRPSRAVARNLLFSDQINHNKLLNVSLDGTVSLMDRQAGTIIWKFATGIPLFQSEQADPDLEYYLFFEKDGRLCEHSKEFHCRELKLNLEELVHGEPIIGHTSYTVGSKVTTLHFLNETNGEILSRHSLPASGTKIRVPLVQEKLVASKLEAADGYIMLLRTDYSLRSIDFPIDATQISSGLVEPLWQVSRSDFSAIYVKRRQPSDVGDKPALPSPRHMIIPVFLPPEFKRNNNEGLMLPPSYPHYLQHHSQEALMLPSAPSSVNNFAEILQSTSRNDEIQELPDDENSSFSSSNKVPKSANYLLGYPVADQLSISDGSCEPGNSQSESGGKCPNDNIISTSLALYKDKYSHLARNDYRAVKSSHQILTGVIYRKFAWIAIPFLPIILALWLLKVRIAGKDDEKGKQSTTPKKKKARKTGIMKNVAIASNNKDNPSGKAKVNGHLQVQNDWLHSFKSLVTSLDAGDGRWVGKLFVSNSEIGRGSNGTVVLEGVYDGRPVAVKRLLRAHHDVAFKEIENLIASDRHPNIVRWYGVEQDLDFVYISLERCSGSLSDLIQLCSDSSLHSTVSENQTSRSINKLKVSLFYDKSGKIDLELWGANGFPSHQLLKLMRDVVAGLAHLHELGIIHRDMKPQNVLISTGRYTTAKLSDMGISKRLVEDMSSLSYHATGYGSSGWQAPEQLLHGRQTRAVDLFSLGCILFFCITKGKHPFGNHFERDANIVNNHIDLFLVDHMPEVVDLLSQLLDPNPNMRLSAIEVLHHPFFWNPETRLTFLRDASDRVELEDRENGSELLKALENVAAVAFNGKWGEKLDAAFISDMGRYRKYKFDSMRDLLRVIRNKLNHYRELPAELQEILGPIPDGFDGYFSSRFPNLLIQVYRVIHGYCSDEDGFKKYFKDTLL